MTAIPPPAPFIAPSRNQRAWETLVVTFGGLDWPAPGVATINGADIEDDWDVKEAQGQNGATTSRKGEKIKSFESVHQLSDAPGSYAPVEGVDVVDDHVQWTAFQWVLRSAMRAEPPAALSVRHPKLQLKEIDAAVPTKIAGPEFADGFTVFTVSWLTYAPVVKTGGTGVADPDKPENRTKSDDEIDRELEEYDRLQDEWKVL